MLPGSGGLAALGDASCCLLLYTAFYFQELSRSLGFTPAMKTLSPSLVRLPLPARERGWGRGLNYIRSLIYE